MTLTNNKQNVRYLFYQVNGIPKSVKFGPLETISVSDFTSTSQIIYNQLDYKLKSYNERFGTVFSLDFALITGSTDYHLLDTWYAALSVKPSASLWTDLQALANGMYEDGDWGEADFISLTAALETDEQRLKPLKTTGAANMTLDGTDLTFSVSGVTDLTAGFSSGLNSGWNPGTHGVKYVSNSAFYGQYWNMPAAITVLFNSGVKTTVGSKYLYLDLQSGIADVVMNATSAINYGAGPTFSKADFSAVLNKNVFASAKKLPDPALKQYRINNVQQTDITTSFGVPTHNLYIYGLNQNGTLDFGSEGTLRFSIAGSSNISHDRVVARLQTFFTARGLTISNY